MLILDHKKKSKQGPNVIIFHVYTNFHKRNPKKIIKNMKFENFFPYLPKWSILREIAF